MKIKKITKIKDKIIPYDIQTSTSNFFANGVLVHNCTWTRDEIYARSTSSNGGILRERVKALWSGVRYENLESPFYIFSVFNDDCCLSWDDVWFYSDWFHIPTVPVIYEGFFNNNTIDMLKSLDLTGKEGYVIRKRESFKYEDYATSVAKFVRKDHVQTDIHWSKNLKENGFKN